MEHTPGAKLIDKAADVLFLCRDAGGPVGVTETARRLGMPKSSAARIVAALVRRGFLRQEEPSGKYALSNIYYTFTSALSERNLLIPRAVPVMEKVFRALRETIHLNVADGLERVCVHVLESPQQLKAVMPVGQRSPLYCGGSSKALLAFSDEETVERVFARPFRKFTGDTITGKKAMREEIHRIRERGYAVSHGERVEGITSVSVPVFHPGGQLAASLTVSVPTARHTESLMGKILRELSAASAGITRGMG
ncbi:MAG TPA: IclR family transcriptional regulator [Candidatus Deferrimicrobium sp.]